MGLGYKYFVSVSVISFDIFLIYVFGLHLILLAPVSAVQTSGQCTGICPIVRGINWTH